MESKKDYPYLKIVGTVLNEKGEELDREEIEYDTEKNLQGEKTRIYQDLEEREKKKDKTGFFLNIVTAVIVILGFLVLLISLTGKNRRGRKVKKKK